ncbi:MAG: hypothetical protein AUI47_04050 [Acidobacteria bacterium 13_1_40CM_2_68_5]|nr:MAG: hypothetical protein AUI47_04050 [Acidobacteria bacterium 13_1_40CM_2_68_5]
MRDLRDAARAFKGRPGFSVAAVLTLALGIGANTSIFSVVNALLLRDLPFRDPDRLVWVWSTRTDRDKAFFSIPNFIDTTEQNRTLEATAAYANWGANLLEGGEPERLRGIRLTADALRMLGVQAIRGRVFAHEDGQVDSARVVLLSHGLWKRRFGGDPSLVGRTLVLSGDSYSVVGILPPTFFIPGAGVDIVVPLVLEADPRRAERGSNFLRVLARLKPGVARQQAQADLAAITKRLAERYPEPNGKLTVPRVVFLHDEVVGGDRPVLLLLFGAVGLVLLIACANIASLLIARASTRAREMAIRAALGATRRQLARQLFAESLLLALLGGVLGLFLAWWGTDLLLALSPASLPRIGEVSIDARVLWFTLAGSLLSGLLSGIAPAVHGSRIDLNAQLRGKGAGVSASGGRTRNILVASQLGLSLVLLIGVGLFSKSYLQMRAVDTGFDPDRLLFARLSLPAARYSTPQSVRTFYDRLAPALAELPGVVSVGAASILPLSGMNARADFTIVGRPALTPQEVPAAQNRWVSPGYFRAMGIPIQKGREFDARDEARASPVVVIDETLARLQWPGTDPLGQHLRIDDAGGAAPRDVEIVGVAGNVRHFGLDEEPLATVYAPFYQVPPGALSFLANNLSLIVRTATEPGAMATAVRRAIGHADPEVPASAIRTAEQVLSTSLAVRRFDATVLGMFAAAAVLLCGLGLYTLVVFSIQQRAREVAIRIALGARPGRLLRSFVGQGLRLALAGSVLGLCGALVSVRLAAGLLFGVAATDAPTFVAAALFLAGVAALASYLPARRVTRIDPTVTLRSE